MAKSQEKTVKQIQLEKKKRLKQAIKKRKKLLFKTNKFKPFIFSLLLVLFFFGFKVSTDFIQKVIYEKDYYSVNNVPLELKTLDGFEGLLLQDTVRVTVMGDKRVIQKFRENNTFPTFTVNVLQKKEGNYKLVPTIEKKYRKLDVKIQPKTVDVKLIAGKRHVVDVSPTYFGVVKEGYDIKEIIPQEQATYILPSNVVDTVVNVVAEIDATKVTADGIYRANVYLMNEYNEIISYPLVKEQIQVEVKLKELGWVSLQREISTLKTEIKQLDETLKEKQNSKKKIKNKKQEETIQKEIKTITSKIKQKKQDVASKTKQLKTLKDKEEKMKKSQEKLSILQEKEKQEKEKKSDNSKEVTSFQ